MHKKINEVYLDGFTAHSVEEGESVDLVSKSLATSESSLFFVFAEQIANLIFPKLGVSNDTIDRYVMVLHPDNTADVYLHDFKTVSRAQLNRPIQAGEIVFRGDITAIDEVRFPDVPIAPGDRLVYFERRGWRFGIVFDLAGKTDADGFAKDAARLQKALILDDILQITLAELHKSEIAQCDAFVITEGKTDWRHLERAFREIGYRRSLRYEASDKDRGDEELLAICQHLALEPRERPVICIFDRDNELIIRKLERIDPAGGSYQVWGNNVYSLMLPIPAHRGKYKNISIEMYYSDEVLGRWTPDGKKLCFDNELKTEKLPGKPARLLLIPPDESMEFGKKPAASNIDHIEDDAGRKVGLSKAAFAELIRSKLEPFGSVDFESFESLADILESILHAATPP